MLWPLLLVGGPLLRLRPLLVLLPTLLLLLPLLSSRVWPSPPSGLAGLMLRPLLLVDRPLLLERSALACAAGLLLPAAC